MSTHPDMRVAVMEIRPFAVRSISCLARNTLCIYTHALSRYLMQHKMFWLCISQHLGD